MRKNHACGVTFNRLFIHLPIHNLIHLHGQDPRENHVLSTDLRTRPRGHGHHLRNLFSVRTIHSGLRTIPSSISWANSFNDPLQILPWKIKTSRGKIKTFLRGFTFDRFQNPRPSVHRQGIRQIPREIRVEPLSRLPLAEFILSLSKGSGTMSPSWRS